MYSWFVFLCLIDTFISVFKRRTVLQYDRARVVFCTTSLPPLPAVYTINFAFRTKPPSVSTTLHESPRRKGHTGLTTLADCTMTILYCTARHQTLLPRRSTSSRSTLYPYYSCTSLTLYLRCSAACLACWGCCRVVNKITLWHVETRDTNVPYCACSVGSLPVENFKSLYSPFEEASFWLQYLW